MLRWGAAAVVSGVLTVLALLGIAGQYPGEGPVVLAVTPQHGVHLGDLAVAVAWGVGVVLVAGLARTPAASRVGSGAGSEHR